jgi:hypothetical protein
MIPADIATMLTLVLATLLGGHASDESMKERAKENEKSFVKRKRRHPRKMPPSKSLKKLAKA